MSVDLMLLLVGATAQTREQIAEILGTDTSREYKLRDLPDIARLQEALEQPGDADAIDLVLLEHDLSGDIINECLATLKALDRDIPLLVLSEATDPEVAVEAIRAGARDWIITHHLPQRLLPAIVAALSDVERRAESTRVAVELQDSRRQYHQLAETMPQGVYELNREGRFTFVNQRGLELFGYTREDLERRPHAAALIAEKDRQRAMQRVRDVLSGNASEKPAEYDIIASDGTLIPVLIHSGPITHDGEIVGLRGVVSDLRELRATRRRLRRSEERYRRLVETMGDGLVTIDRDGTITYANQALADTLETHIDHIIGRDAHTLFDRKNAAILADQIERRFTEGVPGVYELEARTASGRELTLHIHATPLSNDAGEIVASLGVITDITEQRRAQEQLLRIKTAVDNASDGIALADAQQVPIYINPAYEELSGYTLEELQEAGGPRATFATDEEFRRVFNEVQATGSFVGEFEGRHASGRIFPVMGRIDVVRDERGEAAGIVAVGADITARRQREEARRLGRARLALVNRLNEMLNAGESIDSIIAAGADGVRDALDAQHVHMFMRRAGDEGDELVMRYSNLPREIEESAFDMSGPDDLLVLPLYPGTDLWRLYDGGEIVELRGEDLARDMRDVERWARPAAKFTGMKLADALGFRYLCMVPLTHSGIVVGHVTVSRAEDNPLNGMERALAEGFAQQMAVILDKARNEQEITHLNQLLEGIIENAAVWFSVIDENGELIVWNHAAERLSGYAHEQVESGAHSMELLYPDPEDRRKAYEHIDEATAGGRVGEIETTITRADGGERRIAWHLQSFEAEDAGAGLVVIGRDITRSHELHEQLLRVQRMDAVGTLAGGIAHDFNNVLTAITGHADLLAAEFEDDHRAAWHASEISDNVKRASRLTRQLLAFARRQSAKPEIVDLNRLIRNMEEMFRRVIPESIDLQLDLSSNLGYTEIDPSQVEQIVMNLVLNARDAMPDGGELRITTVNATLSDDALTNLFDATPGSFVTLQVADSGVGMDEETESHIFEPFFTTKQDSGGTGLGLSTVYGLVRQNKGAVTVYSEIGKGSLFRVYLPRVDNVGNEEKREAPGDQETLKGDETILVVEDADGLRDLIRTILNVYGYTVYTAAHGEQALELEEAHRGEIDLVVSDVVMPEMSGTELADRLLEISPDLKILLISGYPTERAISAGHTDERFSFLQKPFSAVELGQKIREILNHG